MIQQTGQSITFEAFFTASKQGKAGLTGGTAVTVDVYNPAGTKVVNAAAATETGGGLYRYAYANPSTAGGWRAIFKTTDATVDMQHIPSLWEVGVAGVGNLDATVSSRASQTSTDAGFTSLAGEVQGVVDTLSPTVNNISDSLSGLSEVTAQAVWNAALGGFEPGSAGAILNDLPGSAMTLTAGERSAIAAALLDLTNGVEAGETVREFFRALRAVIMGKATVTGSATAFKRIDGATTAVTVTSDDTGNRSASVVGSLD